MVKDMWEMLSRALVGEAFGAKVNSSNGSKKTKTELAAKLIYELFF